MPHSFLLQLRNLAAEHPNVLQKKLLRDAADNIQAKMVALHVAPTGAAMRDLAGSWAYGHRQFVLAGKELGVELEIS